METASTTPDDIPQRLSSGVRACDKLLGYRGVHTAEKFFPQIMSPIFIPTICLIDILLCFRRYYYFSVHSDFEPCVLTRPTKAPKPGCSSSWPFDEPTPSFAIHAQEPLMM